MADIHQLRPKEHVISHDTLLALVQLGVENPVRTPWHQRCLLEAASRIPANKFCDYVADAYESWLHSICEQCEDPCDKDKSICQRCFDERGEELEQARRYWNRV